MNLTTRLVTHGKQDSFTLPGSWPGRLKGDVRIVEEDACTVSSWALHDTNGISVKHNILLFSRNNYIIGGIRYCLEDLSGIRFRATKEYENITSQISNFSPDLVIFTPQSVNDVRRVSGILTLLHCTHPHLNVIVVSHAKGILSRLADVWRNFLFINLLISPNKFRTMVADELARENITHTFLQELLTSRQWDTLCLLSRGLSIGRIAEVMRISPKTVSLHRAASMRRLGVNTKLHEAWIIEGIRDFGGKTTDERKCEIINETSLGEL